MDFLYIAWSAIDVYSSLCCCCQPHASKAYFLLNYVAGGT